MNDRRQEERKHIFAINGAPEFLNLVRELFQEEGYNVTTTNYVPKSFNQIAALQPDALIVDVVVGEPELHWCVPVCSMATARAPAFRQGILSPPHPRVLPCHHSMARRSAVCTIDSWRANS